MNASSPGFVGATHHDRDLVIFGRAPAVARTRRPRVLFVQRPRGGGSATGLCDVVRRIDRDRFEPVVLFYCENRYCDVIRDAGIDVLVLNEAAGAPTLPTPLSRAALPLKKFEPIRQAARMARQTWPTAKRIRDVIRRVSPDLVHHNDNPRGDRASILAAAMEGIPQVCHVRFTPEYLKTVDAAFARYVERYVFVSEAVGSHFRRHLRRAARRGTVIYDPFDFEVFGKEAALQAERVRRELGLIAEDVVVSNLGRIVPWKGQEDFLRAIARASPRYPRLRALIVGEPPEGDESGYIESLKQLAGDLGLAERVTFTGFRSDVAEIMAASDIVVHSARTPEPFGRVIVEAMAIGRPVVATSGGGALEIVDHGVTGVLVPLKDPEGIAVALGGLLDNPVSTRLMAERAQSAVRERYTDARFCDAIHQIYEDIIPMSADRRRTERVSSQ